MTTRRFHTALQLIFILTGPLFLFACGAESGPATKKPGDSTSASADGDDAEGVAAGTTEAAPGEASAAGKEVAAFQEGEKVSDPTVTYGFRLRPAVGETYGYRIIQDNDTELEGVKLSERIVYNFTVKVTGAPATTAPSLRPGCCHRSTCVRWPGRR